MKVKVAIVDDECLFRAGFAALLKEFNDLEVIISVSNGKELLHELEYKKPDIIFLDVEYPKNSRIETLEQLKEKHSKIKVLILGSQIDFGLMVDMLRAGAHEYLLKDFTIQEIKLVIDAIIKPAYNTHKSASDKVLYELIEHKNNRSSGIQTNLTKREVEIIGCLCQEYTSKEISNRLCISAKTVGHHRENIQKKLGVTSSIGVVLYAIKNSLIKI